MTQTTPDNPKPLDRRCLLGRLALGGIFIFLAVQAGLLVRMLFPRTRQEGPRFLRAGKPAGYAIGMVDQRFLQSHRLWVVRTRHSIYALYARCTHLGCTPVWDRPARKFKCPCHGSGFAPDGTNLEGPAPTPLERFKVYYDPTGQLVIDLGTRLQQGPDGRWSGAGAELALGPTGN